MTASTGNRQRDFPLSALSMATDDGGFSCKLRHSETNLTGLLSVQQKGGGGAVKPEKAMTKIGKKCIRMSSLQNKIERGHRFG